MYLLTGGMWATALTLEILCLLLKFSCIFQLTVTRFFEARSLQLSSPVLMGNPLVPGPELVIWKEELVGPGLAWSSQIFWGGTDMMGFGAPPYPSCSRIHLPTHSSLSSKSLSANLRAGALGEGICVSQSYIPPQIPSVQQGQAQGFLCPGRAGESWVAMGVVRELRYEVQTPLPPA